MAKKVRRGMPALALRAIDLVALRSRLEKAIPSWTAVATSDAITATVGRTASALADFIVDESDYAARPGRAETRSNLSKFREGIAAAVTAFEALDPDARSLLLSAAAEEQLPPFLCTESLDGTGDPVGVGADERIELLAWALRSAASWGRQALEGIPNKQGIREDGVPYRRLVDRLVLAYELSGAPGSRPVRVAYLVPFLEAALKSIGRNRSRRTIENDSDKALRDRRTNSRPRVVVTRLAGTRGRPSEVDDQFVTPGERPARPPGVLSAVEMLRKLSPR